MTRFVTRCNKNIHKTGRQWGLQPKVYQTSTERLYPAGQTQAKQKSAQKQSVAQAKDI